MSYGNNNYPQQRNYQQPQQQQQPQEEEQKGFWPNVTGFKIGPSKQGTGNVIQFTVNSFQRGKNKPMLFEEFMAACAQAFQESGGNGVRFIIPFRDGNGPRGPFQTGSIGIMPNTPPAQSFGGGGGGGGRRSYPTQQAQGYSQPQQYGGHAPPNAAPQVTPANVGSAPVQPPSGGRTGRGPAATRSASPSKPPVKTPAAPPPVEEGGEETYDETNIPF